MITSDRKFGIEIEFIAPNARSFRNIRNSMRVESDGSLRPHQYAGEYVSDILQGKEGARTISTVCSVLKKNMVDINNPKTSVHVHLDGRKLDGCLVADTKRDTTGEFQVALSNRAKKNIPESGVLKILLGNFYPLSGFVCTNIDNVMYISYGKITRHPRLNYTYYSLNRNDRIPWLTRMLYFYTKYSDVMESLVSNSRRAGNMYCVPLSDSFTLDEIEAIKTENDFINVWYKGRGIGGHYDDSRYHNVNFHSYFDRHGTVEIRSHGGTIDANKILLWTRLHQFIADKLELLEFDDLRSDEDTYVSFLKFIKDDELLEEYCKRLLGYFSNITIQGEKKIIKKNNY